MSDLISRQAAIDEIDDWWITVDDNRHPIDVIKALPSAQPEIIRCKDCKHYDTKDCADGFGWCNRNGTGHGSTDDWFCADGERREEWQSKK